jgi:hypothetical protein
VIKPLNLPYEEFYMKKFMVILFVLFITVFSVFAQEQIGTRLKYEVLSPNHYINHYDYNFRITDVYATDWVYSFSFRRSVNTIFDIYYGDYKKNNTAELYSDDFQNIIIQYITSTARDANGNAEWIQYASTIANKMAVYIKARNPDTRKTSEIPQHKISTSYSGRM